MRWNCSTVDDIFALILIINLHNKLIYRENRWCPSFDRRRGTLLISKREKLSIFSSNPCLALKNVIAHLRLKILQNRKITQWFLFLAPCAHPSCPFAAPSCLQVTGGYRHLFWSQGAKKRNPAVRPPSAATFWLPQKIIFLAEI